MSENMVNIRHMTRRNFLWLSTMSAAGFLVGCAINPVTGEKQFMVVSESQEIAMDKQYAPHQFSADYGSVQDASLNGYIQQVGSDMAANTHRQGMPYSFRVVNANYVNAYAFPGGSIAATRGIMLSLENEGELAALLGHELGHVNARHAAEQMSKNMLVQAAIGGAAAYVGMKHQEYAQIVTTLGMVGGSMLLAKYSRDNERQADDLGMEYMVKSGYNPEGMIGLMDMLKSMSKHKPSAIETMFATHPMSDERYNTSISNAKKYQSARNYTLQKERYMDNTARLRSIKGAIEEMQVGESAMVAEKFSQAENHFKSALKKAPGDYAGLVLTSKCLLAQNKTNEAEKYAELAQQTYPKEAQAYQLSGIAKLNANKFSAAYRELSVFDKLLPGDPDTAFMKGFALEKMNNKKGAANEYARYLNMVQQGDQAQHSYQRLVDWGYIK